MTPPNDAEAASRRQPARRLWGAAALAAAQVCLLGPALIFVDNRAEFVGGSWLAIVYLVAGFVALTVLAALPGIVATRGAERWSAALLALTALMWGQSFVSGRYGLLDGTQIDWAAWGRLAILEWLVWGGVLGVGVVFARRLLPWLWRLAIVALVVQGGAAVYGAQAAQDDAKPDRDLENLSRFAALSAERNLVVLVLDAVRGREAEEVLQADEGLRRGFAGFRLFRDHVAAFPTTRFSVPVMLSGEAYDNEERADLYVERVLAGDRSVTRRLAAAGFDVGVASTVRSVLTVPADVVVAAEHYSLTRARRDTLGIELLDLSLFRHLPLSSKRWVLNDGAWRLRGLFGAAGDYHATRSQRFLEGLTGHLRVGLDRPAFRFVHVGGAHVPLVVDAECRFLGVQPEGRKAYREQVACALRQALGVVEGLEAIGVLDETFLVITSDHGTFLQDEEVANKTPVDRMIEMADSLLLVKELGARGELVFDPRPTSGSDLASLIVAAAASEAASGPESWLPAPRPDGRVAFFHEWQHGDWRRPYLTSLHEFRVAPRAGSMASWRYVGTTPSPELSPAARAEQTRIGRRMGDLLERARRSSPGAY